MFSELDRQELLDRLVERAREDPMVEAAALVGSAARRTTDRWSDIDLALGLSAGTDPVRTADRWIDVVESLAEVADTLDIWAGPALYRVLLLQTSLQVDLSFWPSGTLAPTGGQAFELLFGSTGPPPPASEPNLRHAVGWGWLYALHTRSAIARGRLWQAAQMLDGLRGQIVIVCCGRRGLEAHHGRGADQLPRSILDDLGATLPSTASGAALTAAFTRALELLGTEVELLDPLLGERLRVPLEIMGATGSSSPTRNPAATDRQHHSRLVDGRRHHFWTDKLWEAARELPVHEVEIADIAELDQDCWFHARVPSMRQVAAHVGRIQDADLGYPIILAADGSLMDGGHRISKAWLTGRSSVDAVRFVVDPPLDWVTDDE